MSAQTLRFGSIALAPGVTRAHVLTYFYASFFSVSLVTVLNFLQAYLLGEQLAIPENVQGALIGDLGFLNEVVALLMIVPLGVWSDRVGRRFVIVGALLVLAVSYLLLPFVTTVPQLYAFRTLHSVGAAAVTGMLGIIAADYAQKDARGRLVAWSSMLIGLGVVIVVRGIGVVPDFVVGRGFDDAQGGQAASVAVGLLCLVSALVLRLGLRGGRPLRVEEPLPARRLLREGLRAGRDPRILLAYSTAFVSRADQAILGLFLSLWALQVGRSLGMSSAEALANSTTPFIVAAIAGLLWAPVLGSILDRVASITGIAIALSLGCLGYFLVGLIDNPLARGTLPLFAMLGIGQISTLIGAQTLIAKLAPPATRGSVIGVFGFFGAVGMMLTSIIGGRLFDSIGPNAPFIAVGALQAILLLLALVLRARSPGADAVV